MAVVGRVFWQQNYDFALATGSPYREAVNRALLRLMETGDYQLLYKKGFGRRKSRFDLIHIETKERPMSWLKKSCVVAPIDFSEQSFKALEVAKEFVEETSNLHLIHVTRPWDEHDIGGTWGQETEAERLQSIENVMQTRLKSTDYPDARIAVRIGSPAVEICRYAEEAGAELIVMPSHGRTGIKHFALGSVAERVLRRAPCPVLVLREEKKEDDKGKKILSYD